MAHRRKCSISFPSSAVYRTFFSVVVSLTQLTILKFSLLVPNRRVIHLLLEPLSGLILFSEAAVLLGEFPFLFSFVSSKVTETRVTMATAIFLMGWIFALTRKDFCGKCWDPPKIRLRNGARNREKQTAVLNCHIHECALNLCGWPHIDRLSWNQKSARR